MFELPPCVSFVAATEGKRPFKPTSCSTGKADGEHLLGELGHINGKELPSTVAGEKLRVHWEAEGTDKSGDIPAAKLTSETELQATLSTLSSIAWTYAHQTHPDLQILTFI